MLTSYRFWCNCYIKVRKRKCQIALADLTFTVCTLWIPGGGGEEATLEHFTLRKS